MFSQIFITSLNGKNGPITFNYTFKLLIITFKTIENSLYIQRTLELSTADLQRSFLSSIFWISTQYFR